MKTSDLVFIGIKGSAVALHRVTGTKVWATHLKGAGFVNVVLDGDAILASCQGEIFCLDPLTGNILWNNSLTGFGLGLVTIAAACAGSRMTPVVAEQRRRDEAASSTAAASTAATAAG